MRQIVTLFDEYQSKENAKHTLRAMCENARQGYWNGARPPIGYRTVAVEKRGAKVKKVLEIDPLHAGTIRLIFRLALEGVDGGPMGVKAITCVLNARDIRTRDGGRWGIGQVHAILTRTTYMGEHRFNRNHARTKQRKAATEHAIMGVPPLIAEHDFIEVQNLLRSRNPNMMPPQAVGGPTLLIGICFCASCGGAMTIRIGTSSSGIRYRYYQCSTRARQGTTGCQGPAIRMDRLDEAVIDFLRSTLLALERIEVLMGPLLTHRESWADRRQRYVVEMRERADEAERKLRNLLEAVEDDMLASTDRMFGERIAELSTLRERAEMEADRIESLAKRAGPTLEMQDVIRTVSTSGAVSPVFRRSRSTGHVGRKTEVARAIARLQLYIEGFSGAGADQFLSKLDQIVEDLAMSRCHEPVFGWSWRLSERRPKCRRCGKRWRLRSLWDALPPRQPREDGTGPALRLGRAGLPAALFAGGGPPCNGTVLPAEPNGDGPCQATARAVRGQPRSPSIDWGASAFAATKTSHVGKPTESRHRRHYPLQLTLPQKNSDGNKGRRTKFEGTITARLLSSDGVTSVSPTTTSGRKPYRSPPVGISCAAIMLDCPTYRLSVSQ